MPFTQEPFVIAHQHVRFDLLSRIQADADDDQQRCPAEIKRDVQLVNQKFRNHTDDRQVQCPGKRDVRQYLIDIIGCPLPGPDAGNEPSVLLHVVGHVDRIQDHRRVKETKKQNQPDIHQRIEQRSRRQLRTDRLDPGRFKKSRDGRRKRNDRRRKNRRDHARRIDLQRNVGTLAAIDPASHHPLRVLHRNLAPPAFQKHNRGHDGHHQRRKADQQERVELADLIQIIRLRHGRRQTCHDAGKDNQGDPVADAALRNLLAQPHQESRCRPSV